MILNYIISFLICFVDKVTYILMYEEQRNLMGRGINLMAWLKHGNLI